MMEVVAEVKKREERGEAQQENSHVRFDSYVLPLQIDVKFEQKKIKRCVDTVSLSSIILCWAATWKLQWVNRLITLLYNEKWVCMYMYMYYIYKKIAKLAFFFIWMWFFFYIFVIFIFSFKIKCKWKLKMWKTPPMSSANQLNGQTHARLIISNQRQSKEKQQGLRNLPKISNTFD